MSPEVLDAPVVPSDETVAQYSVPEAPEIPSDVADEDRQRKAKNPRLTPPEGGWKTFPPKEGEPSPDGMFDPEKHSFPVKKDFNESGPFYENWRIQRVEEEIDSLQKTKAELKEEVKVWEECGYDKEKVDARRSELRTKNKLLDAVTGGKMGEADLLEILKAAKAQGMDISKLMA